MITVETLGSSSKGNAYRLRSGSRSLLLECGLPWKEIRRKLNFETSELDGCLCTHAHGDHFKAARELMANGIDVYASMDTFEWGAVSPNHHRAKQFHQPYYSFIVRDYWEVIPFKTVHDVSGSVGFFIECFEDRKCERLIFLTDTAYCKFTFPPANIIMIEANFSEEILQRNVEAGLIDPARAKRVRENHMSIERVVEFLKKNDLSRCRSVHLLHLSSGNSDAGLFKRLVQEQTGIPTFVEGS